MEEVEVHLHSFPKWVAKVSFPVTVRERVTKICANARKMVESATANVTQGTHATLTNFYDY